uniref:Uncharacterized protein n=1 Tax=Arundo donax TaxID=35708 RepID=A0A0A9CFY7_ARUDO
MIRPWVSRLCGFASNIGVLGKIRSEINRNCRRSKRFVSVICQSADSC